MTLDPAAVGGDAPLEDAGEVTRRRRPPAAAASGEGEGRERESAAARERELGFEGVRICFILLSATGLNWALIGPVH